jgi:hypothetical protein
MQTPMPGTESRRGPQLTQRKPGHYASTMDWLFVGVSAKAVLGHPDEYFNL